MIVVDASAVLEMLLGRPSPEKIEKRLFAPGQTLHAPHLLDIEVAQVLRRYAASGQINPDRGRAAMTDFLDLPFNRYPHDFLLSRVWELRSNLSTYDAVYVALAEILAVSLLTRDRRLMAAARQHARVELI